MMKKWLPLLLCVTLLFTLAACDKKDPEPAPEPASEPASEGGMIENEFWSLTYSGDWVVDEASSMKSEGVFATALLAIPDGDTDAVCVYLEAARKDVSDYRDMLSATGEDVYTLVTMDTAEYTNIGGIDFLREDGTFNDSPMIHYFARVENAGITVQLRVTGEVEDPRVQELLDTVRFSPEDVGNVDPPWPWEGEPIVLADHAAQLGSAQVMAKQLLAKECIISDNPYDGHLAAFGDQLFVLYRDSLKIYNVDGKSLAFSKDVPLDDNFKYITACENGIVYLADYEHKLVGLQNGEETVSYDCENYVVMHPSGEWGLSFLTYNDVEKITLSGDSFTSESWILDAVSSISSVSISRDHILVSGESAQTGFAAVFVYDFNGELLMTLGGQPDSAADALGSVSAAVETPTGFLALDSTGRRVAAWTPDGSFCGATDDEYLFGTRNPYMNSMASDGNGNIYVGMAEQRPDQSASEYILFSVTGY